MTFGRFILLSTMSILPVVSDAQEAKPPLSGEWTTDCLPIGKNGRHGYVTRINIQGDEIRATSQIYSKSSCQTPTVQANYAGKIQVGEIAGGQVDFTHEVETITLTPNIDDVAEHYNKDAEGSGCGLTGWKTNIAVSVAGRTCAPFSFASQGATLYDRAWIDGNQLRFGAFPSEWSATSNDQRPVVPIETVFYRTGN